MGSKWAPFSLYLNNLPLNDANNILLNISKYMKIR